jgi:Domain of unknown function (DUF1839)
MSATATGLVSLFGHDPATYQRHPVHADARAYTETNCYTDILIELLHARGDDPIAAMGFTVRMDFEGDQWTFFKPPPADLERLFGVDIHEMQPYRSLPLQIAEQLSQGRTMIIELDAWYLPDTQSTSYRSDHVKTSVAVEAIDRSAQTLRYFHNAGLYELSGEDYRGVFRLDGPLSDDVLPPYTELVRFDAGARLQGEELRRAARELLSHHLQLRPESNPFERFGAALSRELPELLSGDAAHYHAYAFATVRMVGSAFEIAASHVDWLLEAEGRRAAGALMDVVEGSKTLSFKLARRKEFDPAPAIAALADGWERAMSALESVPA